MGKKKFIQECLEKLEDLNEYQIKGGKMASTGQYDIKDFTDNLLPILKDLIEENMKLEVRIKELEDEKKRFRREGFELVSGIDVKVGLTD